MTPPPSWSTSPTTSASPPSGSSRAPRLLRGRRRRRAHAARERRRVRGAGGCARGCWSTSARRRPRRPCWAREVSMPVLVAPVAFQRLAHPDGEVGMARAAAAAGTIMMLSTIATARPRGRRGGARRAALVPALLLPRPRRDAGAGRRGGRGGLRGDRADRRRAAAGRRERDLRTGSRPAGASACRASPRRWASDRALTIAEVFALVDPTLTWGDLERLASDCELPVLVKGILTAEDARARRRARRRRGGRLEPRRPPARRRRRRRSTRCPRWSKRSTGACEVLMDGGIRRGHRRAGRAGARRRAVSVGPRGRSGASPSAARTGRAAVLEMPARGARAGAGAAAAAPRRPR